MQLQISNIYICKIYHNTHFINENLVENKLIEGKISGSWFPQTEISRRIGNCILKVCIYEREP